MIFLPYIPPASVGNFDVTNEKYKLPVVDECKVWVIDQLWRRNCLPSKTMWEKLVNHSSILLLFLERGSSEDNLIHCG